MKKYLFLICIAIVCNSVFILNCDNIDEMKDKNNQLIIDDKILTIKNIEVKKVAISPSSKDEEGELTTFIQMDIDNEQALMISKKGICGNDSSTVSIVYKNKNSIYATTESPFECTSSYNKFTGTVKNIVLQKLGDQSKMIDSSSKDTLVLSLTITYDYEVLITKASNNDIELLKGSSKTNIMRQIPTNPCELCVYARNEATKSYLVAFECWKSGNLLGVFVWYSNGNYWTGIANSACPKCI